MRTKLGIGRESLERNGIQKMVIDTFKFIDQHGSLNKINRGELDELWNSLQAKYRASKSQNSFILLERAIEHAVKSLSDAIRITTTVASRLCPWAEGLYELVYV